MSDVKIERVTSLLHEVGRMERSRRMSAEAQKALQQAGLGNWSFLLCAWTYGEQPVIVVGNRAGSDVLETVKQGAEWLLKGAEAKETGDPMPIVTGRP